MRRVLWQQQLLGELLSWDLITPLFGRLTEVHQSAELSQISNAEVAEGSEFSSHHPGVLLWLAESAYIGITNYNRVLSGMNSNFGEQQVLKLD